jgi:hypothetical protein
LAHDVALGDDPDRRVMIIYNHECPDILAGEELAGIKK